MYLAGIAPVSIADRSVPVSGKSKIWTSILVGPSDTGTACVHILAVTGLRRGFKTRYVNSAVYGTTFSNLLNLRFSVLVKYAL